MFVFRMWFTQNGNLLKGIICNISYICQREPTEEMYNQMTSIQVLQCVLYQQPMYYVLFQHQFSHHNSFILAAA
jgi:hypothetical protein